MEAGYGVLVQLVLEKGSASSLKMVYVQLKRDWDLDELRVPGEESLSMRELEDEKFVEVVFES